MTTASATRETLKDLKTNGNELMDQFNEAGERLSKKANEALRDTKRSLYRMQNSTEEAVEEAVRETRHSIRKNPIGSVALAAGVGVGLGILAGYLWGSQRD
jgi:ElaB/YqjD/DUF883 family membrane-anchored ribosome-binding protein